MTNSEHVLVTGGSGYIASFCIAQLLREGVTVRTTVRSLGRGPQIRAAISKLVNISAGKLEIVSADLESDAGWREACSGCSGVLHVASPFPARVPKDDEELVRPARDGALRVLKAARDAGMRRVVMTSSTAAVTYGHGGRSQPFTEADWSAPDVVSDSSSYERSKTIAERAAWEWHAREGGATELVTVCPSAVLGPVLGSDHSASIDIVKRLLDGSLPALPHFGWALVDVRDIADLHLRALRAPNALGQRYIGAVRFTGCQTLPACCGNNYPNWRPKSLAAACRAGSCGFPRWVIRSYVSGSTNWIKNDRCL